MKFLPLLALVLFSCKPTPEPTHIHFRDIAPETGLVFQHRSGADGSFHMPEIMGAGLALFDFDSDGDLDVFLVQSGDLAALDRPTGHKLYRNELKPSGQLRFIDITAEAGLTGKGYGIGAAVGDVNRDGRPDLLVTNYGLSTLFLNQGGATFRATPIGAADQWATSASFFDYDRDGWQDLILLSYVGFNPKTNKPCQAASGEADYCTPKAYPSVPAMLFHNERGSLRNITAASGIDRARGPGLGVVAFDANADSYPDLFVANDTERNHLWLNQRDGTFREAALESGLAYSEDGLAKAGMGVAAGDYDNDGDEDLIVLNLMREGATLFRNDGMSNFRDLSKPSKIHALTFPYTGFGVGFADFDNDGFLDLFLAHGAVTLRAEQRGQAKPFREPKLLLRNHDGASFADVSATAGTPFQTREVSRGAAIGDLDNDGRLDIVVTANDGPVRLLHNETKAGQWLEVQVDRPGIKLTLERESLPALTRFARRDGSYAGSNDLTVHFGLGASKPIRLTAEFPGGERRTIDKPAAGKIHRLVDFN